MLYTVGHTKSYDKALREKEKIGEHLFKVGRKVIKTGLYPGGIVFLTKKEAEDWLKENNHPNYSVYGLDTNKANVYRFKEDNTLRIKRRSKIIELD